MQKPSLNELKSIRVPANVPADRAAETYWGT